MSDCASTSQRQIPEVQVKEEDLTTLPSPKTEANPEVPPESPTNARRPEGQRRAFLQNDPQIQEVEPQRVLCRVCEKWIKLSALCTYSSGNWVAHKQRCSPATPARRTPHKPNFSPSSRVATAERKIVLLNDPDVKMFSPRRVQCGRCMSMVVLGGTVDYELTEWTAHKEGCLPPITPRGPGSRNRAGSRRSRSPVESSETTAVSSAATTGAKRGREEEDVADERPANRARTELIGLLMEPLREFARGFRQGLGST